MFSKLLKTIAICSALMMSSQASASFGDTSDDLDWFIDFDANGSGETIDLLEFNSDALTVVTSTVGGAPATFNNYGFLQYKGVELDTGIVFPGEVPPLGGYTLTGSYDDWKGTFTSYDAGTNIATFTIDEGTIDWFIVDPLGTSTKRMETSIVSASGEIQLATGGLGSVQLTLEVKSADPGYFFIDLGDGNGFQDFSILAADPDSPLYLGYSFSSNGITATPDTDMNGILLDSLSLYRPFLTAAQNTAIDTLIADADAIINGGDGNTVMTLAELEAFDANRLINILYDPNVPVIFQSSFLTSSVSGDLTFSAIPEPGMIGLMGLALFGLAGFQRRRKV